MACWREFYAAERAEKFQAKVAEHEAAKQEKAASLAAERQARAAAKQAERQAESGIKTEAKVAERQAKAARLQGNVMAVRTCEGCGTPFTGNARKFCSRDCYANARATDDPTPEEIAAMCLQIRREREEAMLNSAGTYDPDKHNRRYGRSCRYRGPAVHAD